MDDDANARFRLGDKEKARRVLDLRARLESSTPGKRKSRPGSAIPRTVARGAPAVLGLAAVLALACAAAWLFARM
ncbi:MAG: hypothetical protein HY777_13665 [Betaproteobacteria bacterium]|nr:hypothetical protein [Betaproteobacteria bacterium]